MPRVSLATVFTVGDRGYDTFVSICDRIAVSFNRPYSRFPLDSLPPLVHSTIVRTRRVARTPLKLITTSTLNTISLIYRGLVSIYELGALQKPISLFFLALTRSKRQGATISGLLVGPLCRRRVRLCSECGDRLTI